MNQLQLRARTRLQLAHTRQARQTLKACVQHYFTQAKFKDKKNEIMCFRDVYKSGNNMEKIKKKTYKIQERVAPGRGGVVGRRGVRTGLGSRTQVLEVPFSALPLRWW